MANKKTCLYDNHIASNAKMVDFAGWQMPINYGSQINEHLAVRNDAGMFDVSHMSSVDVRGENARDFLLFVLANDINSLDSIGKALYTCMLDDDGGILDDLIVYYLGDKDYRLVVNAGTTSSDVQWLKEQAKAYDVNITHRADLAMMAIQGPNAIGKVSAALEIEDLHLLERFSCMCPSEDWIVARTGYTGEDGVEVILPAEQAVMLWQKLLDAGVPPIGLGARDSLRMEAGLNLYGNDMDSSKNPYESNLTWTVKAKDERDFIGKSALMSIKEKGIEKSLVGILLEDKGVLRAGQKIICNGNAVGITTSGGFAPSLNRSIGFARIDKTSLKDELTVDIRNKNLNIRVVKMPFVKSGQATF